MGFSEWYFMAVDAVADVSYKDWRIGIHRDRDHDSYYLQVWFDADEGPQHGRKWRLSLYMTRSEIVQTALIAVLAAEEHEAREAFRYKGERIFGPHFDVDLLVELARAGAVDVRS